MGRIWRSGVLETESWMKPTPEATIQTPGVYAEINQYVQRRHMRLLSI